MESANEVKPMTTSVLSETVQRRHDELAQELTGVRDRFKPGGTDLSEPRLTRGMVDQFLADVSQHVNAVHATLVPAAKRRLDDGKQVVHEYLHTARELEVVLAHVKAHAYGSTYETGFSWTEVWDELTEALGRERKAEESMAKRLDSTISRQDGADLAGKMVTDEPNEPTRPHPYVPHTGILGALSRKVMRRADRFWDDAEGRMVRREHKKHEKPGLIGQYFLAKPRFKEE
jgi:hypothetical protein